MYSEKTPIICGLSFMNVIYAQRPPVFVAARPFNSLTFRKSGSITVKSRYGEFVSGPGTLTFIPKGCDYESEILEAGEMNVMHFYTVGDENEKPECAPHPFPVSISNLFSNLISLHAAQGTDLACMSMAYELLSEAHLALTPPTVHPHGRMKKCKEFLDENICNSSLRVSELAKMCGVSEVYFRREFKKFYGTAPLDYIKKRRIEIAEGLLQTGLCTVTDAAMQSGFESVSYFSSEFRRLVGVSPREYGRIHGFS